MIKILEKLFFVFLFSLIAVVMLTSFGWIKLLVVKTGSMRPNLSVNTLLLIEPQKSLFQKRTGIDVPKYKVGQIISFKSPEKATLITHRVFSVTTIKGQVVYQTKGDANDSKDAFPTLQSSVFGKVIFALPGFGVLINFLGSFLGLFILVILPASFVILHEVLVINEELKGGNVDKKIIAGPIIVIMLLVLATPVYSLFSGSVFLTSNSLSTRNSFLEIPAECLGITFSGSPIIGTEGNDNLHGTNGNDLIFALGGNDKVSGSSGNDCIVGGDGNDELNGGSDNDVILGGLGDDSIAGGSGDDKIFGEDGNDIIDGGSGNDVIHGGNNNDSLKGGSGSDQIFGDAGDDNLIGSSGNDVLDGEGDINFEDGGSGMDTCLNASTKVRCEF